VRLLTLGPKPTKVFLTLQSSKLIYDLGNEIIYKDPVLAASVLKDFLRDLPEVIFTEELKYWFLELGRDDPHDNDKENIQIYKTLISKMPSVNKEVLGLIMQLLYNVALHSDTNKMNAYNLGIYFGPTLFLKRNQEPNDAHAIGKVIEFMVTNYALIFPPLPN